MNISITVTGQPRPNGSIVRSGVDFPISSFDEQTSSRLLDAVRRCHRAVQAETGHVAQASGGTSTGNQHARTNGGPRLATVKQVRAIHAMADRQGIDLKNHLHDQFSVSSVTALTIRQASELIDELKGRLQSA